METFTFHSHSATHKNHGVCRINYCFKCGAVFQQFRMALLDLCPLWIVLLCLLRLAGSHKMSHLCPTVWAFFLSWTLWTGGCSERDRVCGEEKREGEVGRKWVVPVGSWGWGQWWINKWIYTQHHTRTLYIIGANFFTLTFHSSISGIEDPTSQWWTVFLLFLFGVFSWLIGLLY